MPEPLGAKTPDHLEQLLEKRGPLADHPVFLAAQLREAHAELWRRIRYEDRESQLRQMTRVEEYRQQLEESLSYYKEAILLHDLRLSVEARRKLKREAEACEREGRRV